MPTTLQEGLGWPPGGPDLGAQHNGSTAHLVLWSWPQSTRHSGKVFGSVLNSCLIPCPQRCHANIKSQILSVQTAPFSCRSRVHLISPGSTASSQDRRRESRGVARRHGGRTATGRHGPLVYRSARLFQRTHSQCDRGRFVDADLLVDALLGLFKLVVIDLEDNDDAQVIFEVLNGRQTPLSATDLVKNLLFLRAELDSEADIERLYDRHWAEFDDPWWRKEMGRGHAARGRRDVLLSAWLTAATGTEVSVGHLYSEVRRYLDVGSHKTTDILPVLSIAARAFREIEEIPSSIAKRMAAAYRRLNRLSVTTVLPLLVWMRTLPSEELSPADHARAIVAIESWVMRRILVGANTRGYGKRFADVLRRAQAAASTTASIVEAIERDLLEDAMGRPG